MTIRTDSEARSTHPIVHVDASVGRATPEGAESGFRALLGDGAAALLGGVEAATRTLPGGAALVAAVQGVAGAAPSTPGAGGAIQSFQDAIAHQGEQQMQYIQLQQQMQDENQRFSTLSNVLKARHETAKTAIGNIR